MSLKQILLSVSRFPRELLVPFQIPGWKQRLVELDINCVPSQMITSEVCVCVWACACAATAWADESQIYFGSGAEHIITVISLSDRKSDGEQDMLGPAGWLKNTHEGEEGKKRGDAPSSISHSHTHTHTQGCTAHSHTKHTTAHSVFFLLTRTSSSSSSSSSLQRRYVCLHLTGFQSLWSCTNFIIGLKKPCPLLRCMRRVNQYPSTSLPTVWSPFMDYSPIIHPERCSSL